MASTRLYVGGISNEITLEQLQDLFGKYGKCKHVGLNLPDSAFVNFETEADASSACDALNGEEFMGLKLRVEFAEGLQNAGWNGSGGNMGRSVGCGEKVADRRRGEYHMEGGSSKTRGGNCVHRGGSRERVGSHGGNLEGSRRGGSRGYGGNLCPGKRGGFGVLLLLLGFLSPSVFACDLKERCSKCTGVMKCTYLIYSDGIGVCLDAIATSTVFAKEIIRSPLFCPDDDYFSSTTTATTTMPDDASYTVHWVLGGIFVLALISMLTCIYFMYGRTKKIKFSLLDEEVPTAIDEEVPRAVENIYS